MATLQDVKKPEDWAFYEFVKKCVNVHGKVYGRCAVAKEARFYGTKKDKYHGVLLIADDDSVVIGPDNHEAYAIGNLNRVEFKAVKNG